MDWHRIWTLRLLQPRMQCDSPISFVRFLSVAQLTQCCTGPCFACAVRVLLQTSRSMTPLLEYTRHMPSTSPILNPIAGLRHRVLPHCRVSFARWVLVVVHRATGGLSSCLADNHSRGAEDAKPRACESCILLGLCTVILPHSGLQLPSGVDFITEASTAALLLP